MARLQCQHCHACVLKMSRKKRSVEKKRDKQRDRDQRTEGVRERERNERERKREREDSRDSSDGQPTWRSAQQNHLTRSTEHTRASIDTRTHMHTYTHTHLHTHKHPLARVVKYFTRSLGIATEAVQPLLAPVLQQQAGAAVRTSAPTEPLTPSTLAVSPWRWASWSPPCTGPRAQRLPCSTTAAPALTRPLGQHARGSIAVTAGCGAVQRSSGNDRQGAGTSKT